MNLSKLFEIQKSLREVIIEKHSLENEYLLENFIVAFQTELAELANEWRGFKHWSLDQNMRREKALEEFADCTAFLLELGLELNIPDEWDVSGISLERNISIQVQLISFNEHLNKCMDPHDWFDIASLLFGLGHMLGFNKTEMIDAYYAKTKINHERQNSGY